MSRWVPIGKVSSQTQPGLLTTSAVACFTCLHSISSAGNQYVKHQRAIINPNIPPRPHNYQHSKPPDSSALAPGEEGRWWFAGSAILGSGILDITDNLAVFTVLFTTENFYLFHFCSPSHHSLVTFEPAVIRHRRHPQAVITSPDKILLQLSLEEDIRDQDRQWEPTLRPETQGRVMWETCVGYYGYRTEVKPVAKCPRSEKLPRLDIEH